MKRQTGARCIAVKGAGEVIGFRRLFSCLQAAVNPRKRMEKYLFISEKQIYCKDIMQHIRPREKIFWSVYCLFFRLWRFFWHGI